MHAKLHSCNLQAVEKQQQQLGQRELHLLLFFLCVKMSHTFFHLYFGFFGLFPLVKNRQNFSSYTWMVLSIGSNFHIKQGWHLMPLVPTHLRETLVVKFLLSASEARVLSFHLKIIIPTYSKTYFTIKYCKSKRYSNNLYYQWGLYQYFNFVLNN